jgi:acyl-CoA synthetase (AMP-forming)/AMP-acid ligase II
LAPLVEIGDPLNLEVVADHLLSTDATQMLMPAVFVPAHIVPLDRLPINAMGKVDRRHLKDTVLGVANS